MKKIFKTLAVVSLLCIGLGAQAQYIFTPKKIFDYWVSQVPGFVDTLSSAKEKPDGGMNPALSNNNSYTYDKNGHSYVDARNAKYENVCADGVTMSIFHANQPLKLYPNQDSIFSQATGDNYFTITLPATVNAEAGSKKVLFEYSPAGSGGRMIEVSSDGGATRYDTAKTSGRRVISYTVDVAGKVNVKFTNKKSSDGNYKGNLNFFRFEIVDAASNYTLTTVANPLKGGKVTKSPQKDGYPNNDTIVLTAIRNAGYNFTRWSDGVTDTLRTFIMPKKDTALTAIFTAIDYNFAAIANDATKGSVTIKEGAPTVAHVGDVFTLMAVPAHAKYRFVKWEDNNSTNPARTFTMPAANTTLTAIFEEQPIYKVVTLVNPAGAGTVTDTGRILREAWHEYYNRDIVDLIATPANGYEFVSWSDGSDDPQHAVRIEGKNDTITAIFRVATGNPPVPTVYPNPNIKVDFNIAGRGESEVHEPGFHSWVVADNNLRDTFDYITVAMAKEGEIGKGLQSTWNKLSVQAPNYARLVGDGVRVNMDDLDAQLHLGTQMSMTFSGLKKGAHTLLMYFNNTGATKDTKTGDTIIYSKVKVYVNGGLVGNVQPSVQAMSTAEAGHIYLEVPVRELEDIKVLLVADTSQVTHIPDTVNYMIQRIVTLSAFILNDPDPNKQAYNPTPSDRDEHVAFENTGSVKLSWRRARQGVDAHNVYVGATFDAVDTASIGSPAYRGNQVDTTYTVSNINSAATYYWRVDAVKGGVVTKGDIWYFRPRVQAFPGAEGYGRYARGARGGKVMYVTNLNNDGAGSLRELTTNNELGPRYILFAVSGRLHLNPGARITLNSPYTTVAGQTAPGKGICISGASYGVSGGHDIIVRFMRVRVGQFGVTIDGMGMSGANYSIMDHNSISWTHDEAFSSRGGKNFTLQNTLISEALNVAGHKNYGYGQGHGYAATIGGDTASFLRNLLIHNQGRNWSLGGGVYGNGYYSGHLDISNNIVYNYGGRVTDGGAHEVNFVNNYYKQGRHSTSGMLVPQHEGVGLGTQKYYAKGNVLEAYNNGAYGTFICSGTEPITEKCGCSNSQWAASEALYEDFVPQPFFPSHAEVLPAKHAFKTVISNSGANMPVLDEHDLRNQLEARDGTWRYKGSFGGMQGIIDHHMDVGGYEKYDTIMVNLDVFDTDRDGLPNWWEEEVSQTNPRGVVGDYTDTHAGDVDNNGYTNMERYLEFMATPHFTTQKNRQVAVELSQYTRGYTKSPVYSVITNGDGAVTINGNWARFQPNNDFKGVTYFEFRVTDSDGDSMVRKIGIRVTK